MKKSKLHTSYVVGGVERQHGVDVFGQTKDLPLTWADGMVGVLPVFSSYDAAYGYAGDRLTIFEIHTEVKP